MVVVGDGPLFNTLKGNADLEAPGRIYFTGQLDHERTMGWVKSADVFVLNSTYEGLSHVLVEAMALGTPVVATEVGGNPELIKNKENGLLYKIPFDNSIGALKLAVEEVEKDRAAAEERAEVAKEKIEKFSISSTIEKVSELIKSI